MTDVTVNWEINGVDAFQRRLRQMARRAEFPEPLLHEIAGWWRDAVEEQFETQGVRFGRKWEKLAPATISKRQSVGPILIDHADLLLTATDPASYRVHSDGISVDIAAHQATYGGYHQTGTTNMPRRPILEFTEVDRRRTYADINDWLFGDSGGRV